MGNYHPRVGKWSLTFHTAEAVQVLPDLSNVQEVEKVAGEARVRRDGKGVRLGTEEDSFTAPAEHWVVRTPDGSVLILDDATFQAMYESADG